MKICFPTTQQGIFDFLDIFFYSGDFFARNTRCSMADEAQFPIFIKLLTIFLNIFKNGLQDIVRVTLFSI